jgi:uncharacterized damage-inducible protein DinB
MPIPYPSHGRGEKESLLLWLEFERDAIMDKIDGLTEQQARWKPAPTANSLIGIVNHLIYVEHWWFHMCFAGRAPELPKTDTGFEVPGNQTVVVTVDRYLAEIARSGRIVAESDSLDEPTHHPEVKRDLRWVLIHMIEETARHAGHADITRELIDGNVGMAKGRPRS